MLKRDGDAIDAVRWVISLEDIDERLSGLAVGSNSSRSFMRPCPSRSSHSTSAPDTMSDCMCLQIYRSQSVLFSPRSKGAYIYFAVPKEVVLS